MVSQCAIRLFKEYHGGAGKQKAGSRADTTKQRRAGAALGHLRKVPDGRGILPPRVGFFSS
jgi:hypothetical protein